MSRTLEEPQRGERGWTGLSGGGQKGQPRAEVTGSQGLEARLAVTPGRVRCGCCAENRLRGRGRRPPSRLSRAHRGDNGPEAAWQQREGPEAVGSWVFWLDSGSRSTLRWDRIQGVGVRMTTERQVNAGKRQAGSPRWPGGPFS